MRLEQHPEPIPILYLDDEQDEASRLESAVQKSFVNPVIPFSRPQALYDYLDMNVGPFIILVDLVLLVGESSPIGGGYEVLDRLRRRPDVIETRSPIVAVTSTIPDDAMVEEVRRHGANAFIHKPVEAIHLVQAIGRPGWFRVELSR